MTYIKTFENKGQMINYYNKMKFNTKLASILTCLSAETKAWTIYYSYKK